MRFPCKALMLCLLIIFVSFKSLLAQTTEEKPWAMDEENIEIYQEGRKPAAIPLTDTIILNNVLKYIKIKAPSGNDVDIKVTDTYGETRRDSSGNRKVHNGWDIAGPLNSVILWKKKSINAQVEGKYKAPWRGNAERANYGNQLAIIFDNNNQKYLLRFCHIANDTNYQSAAVGSWLKQDDAIGKIGVTGRGPNARNPHIHLEIFQKIQGKFERINPIRLFEPDISPTKFRIRID